MPRHLQGQLPINGCCHHNLCLQRWLTFHANRSQRLLYKVKLLFFVVLGMFMVVDKITLQQGTRLVRLRTVRHILVHWLTLQHTTAMGIPRLVVSEPCVRGSVT